MAELTRETVLKDTKAFIAKYHNYDISGFILQLLETAEAQDKNKNASSADVPDMMESTALNEVRIRGKVYYKDTKYARGNGASFASDLKNGDTYARYLVAIALRKETRDMDIEAYAPVPIDFTKFSVPNPTDYGDLDVEMSVVGDFFIFSVTAILENNEPDPNEKDWRICEWLIQCEGPVSRFMQNIVDPNSYAAQVLTREFGRAIHKLVPEGWEVVNYPEGLPAERFYVDHLVGPTLIDTHWVGLTPLPAKNVKDDRVRLLFKIKKIA